MPDAFAVGFVRGEKKKLSFARSALFALYCSLSLARSLFLPSPRPRHAALFPLSLTHTNTHEEIKKTKTEPARKAVFNSSAGASTAAAAAAAVAALTPSFATPGGGAAAAAAASTPANNGGFLDQTPLSVENGSGGAAAGTGYRSPDEVSR